jgi:serine/threonine protein kinase
LRSWSAQGELVAVKKLNACSTPDEYAEFQREVWVMSGHDSPFLVFLHGVCLEPPMLVMEFVGNGTLYGLLRDCRGQALDEALRVRIALDIARVCRMFIAQ